MNGILGFSEFLASPDVSDEDRARYIEIIFENSNQLLNVVNEIVDIAKVQSGHSDIKMEAVNITELLSKIEKEYKVLAEEKELEVDAVSKYSCKNSVRRQAVFVKNIQKVDG